MKRPLIPDGPPRFSGNLRHYHHGNPAVTRTWDQWADGNLPAKAKRRRNRLKITASVLAWLTLAGIVAGLIVELR